MEKMETKENNGDDDRFLQISMLVFFFMFLRQSMIMKLPLAQHPYNFRDKFSSSLSVFSSLSFSKSI